MLQVGDKVRYSSEWLRNTGQQTGEICFAIGVVTSVRNLSKEPVIATVDWNDSDLPSHINVKNLEKVQS